MNLNLYSKEIKRSRKNLLIWTSIVIGFTVMVLALYPQMKGMGDHLEQMMEAIPKSLTKAFGMDSTTWASAAGFYSTYFGIYIVVLTSIYTTSTGATILSKEERDKTAEFLITKPISRSDLFWTKMMSLATLMIIITVAQLLAATICMFIVAEESFPWDKFATMHIHGTALIIFFTGTGVLLASFMKAKTNFMGPVVGIVFGSYFIDALAKATHATDWLGYTSPFRYASFAISEPGYSIHYVNVIALVLIGIGCVYYSSIRFTSKDIDS